MFFISVVSFTAVFGGRLWEFRLKSFRAVWSLRRRLTFTNTLKANANPPINAKKIFMLRPKKNSYNEFDNEIKIGSKIPRPHPITFLMVRPLIFVIPGFAWKGNVQKKIIANKNC